ECRQGRSAFRFWKVTQSITGCTPERGDDQLQANPWIVWADAFASKPAPTGDWRFDRSHAPAWECRQGRSAFRFWKVTQSVGTISFKPTHATGSLG
ncbi:hypothetical protein, partial [Pseudomonas sp. NFACC16-2]|uniref:hypothetical protein n=1 Tax=Pseudomonas sp. NFACC16-2 TaxID=1554560 RepID=UPI001C44B1C9